MSDKPRVTASSEIEAVTVRAICEPFAKTSPSVELRVQFDLHDHWSAITALHQAVRDVEAQIEETRP